MVGELPLLLGDVLDPAADSVVEVGKDLDIAVLVDSRPLVFFNFWLS